VPGGGLCAGGLIELLRQVAAGGRERLHRAHDGIATLEGEHGQSAAVSTRCSHSEPLPKTQVLLRHGEGCSAAERSGKPEVELRRCERREEPGAAAVVTVIRVATHGDSTARRALAIDGVSRLEQLLQRGQGGLCLRVQHAVTAARAPAMQHREHDRNIQLPVRVARFLSGARAVEAPGAVPESVEPRNDLVGRETARLRTGRLPGLLEPGGAAAQRLRLHELRVVVIAAFLLPDIARAKVRVRERKGEIAADDLAECGAQRRLRWREIAPPAQQRQAAQRRPVVLGPGPADEVERAVGVDTDVRQHGLSRQRRDLGVRPHVLQE